MVQKNRVVTLKARRDTIFKEIQAEFGDAEAEQIREQIEFSAKKYAADIEAIAAAHCPCKKDPIASIHDDHQSRKSIHLRSLLKRATALFLFKDVHGSHCGDRTNEP